MKQKTSGGSKNTVSTEIQLENALKNKLEMFTDIICQIN